MDGILSQIDGLFGVFSDRLAYLAHGLQQAWRFRASYELQCDHRAKHTRAAQGGVGQVAFGRVQEFSLQQAQGGLPNGRCHDVPAHVCCCVAVRPLLAIEESESVAHQEFWW